MSMTSALQKKVRNSEGEPRTPAFRRAHAAEQSLLRIEVLIHRERGFGRLGMSGFTRGNADYRGMRRYMLQNDAAGTDFGTFADVDVAKNLRAGADEHATPDLRVAIAAFLTGPAQRNVLQHRDVVADDGGFANDDTCSVVDENPASQARGWVNVDGKDRRATPLQDRRQMLPLLAPERMRRAVGDQRVKALVVEEGVDQSMRRRITLSRRQQIAGN